MKIYINKLLLALSILASSYSHAGILNFIDLTENAMTGLGESAWSVLNTSVSGVGVSITAGGSAGSEYAYLDWRNAGLGACARASTVNVAHKGSSTNRCNPSSDDNVTTGEYLVFNFDQAVTINNLWFNNNHDGGFGWGDMVNIDGTAYNVVTGYAGGANGIGAFSVAANTNFVVAFENEQFYISGLEITHQVPEPGSLVLLGMGFLALGLMRRRYH